MFAGGESYLSEVIQIIEQEVLLLFELLGQLFSLGAFEEVAEAGQLEDVVLVVDALDAVVGHGVTLAHKHDARHQQMRCNFLETRLFGTRTQRSKC